MTRSARAPSDRFRPDIEGLRAVAVLAVVSFHAGVPGLGGGYVGVDVFYVISGFLITGLLQHELQATGRIRLARFYARRARRLLPAATLVLVATVLASLRWLPPLPARSALGDALAAALYAGNYRLAVRGTDYLSASAPPSPFQHFWSLAVEEQFYLVWPLLLLGTALLGWHVVRQRQRVVGHRVVGQHRASVVLLALLAVGSCWLSVRWTRTMPPWAFFSLPTRAWELAVGGLLVLLPQVRRLPVWLTGVLGWLGLAALAGSCHLLGAGTAYPATAALLPVLGAAAVIVAGCRPAGDPVPRRLPGRMLGLPPLRAVGRLSYSWYLWHWPVLLFAPFAVGHPLALPGRLAAVAVSLGLAAITLRLLEDPVRRAAPLSRYPRRGLLLAEVLTCVSLLVVALGARSLPRLVGTGLAAAPRPIGVTAPSVRRTAKAPTYPPSRLDTLTAQVQAQLVAALATRQVPANLTPSLTAAAGDKAAPFVDGCLSSWTAAEPAGCYYADTAATDTVLLMGDSHAAQWFPAFDSIASGARFRLRVLGKSACPPLRLPVYSPYLGRPYTECGQWLSDTLADVRAGHYRLVVLGVARHYGDVYHFTVYSPQWLAALAETVRELRAAGVPVLVLGPIPKPAQDVPTCLSAHLPDAQACTLDQRSSLSAAGSAAERAAVGAAGGSYLDLSRLLCARGRCPVIVGDTLVYRDDNHLTPEYARWLAPVLGAAVAATLAGRPG